MYPGDWNIPCTDGVIPRSQETNKITGDVSLAQDVGGGDHKESGKKRNPEKVDL